MKKILSCLLVITLFISMMTVFATGASAAQDSTSETDVWDGVSVSTSLFGSGTQGDPYLVQSAADLAYIAQQVNAATHDWNAGVFYGKYFKMTCNIDLNNKEWTPIGHACSGALNTYDFNGHFDGDGHVIYNLVIGSNNAQYACVGLFGAVYGGSVKNLGIESGTIYVNKAGAIVGALVGRTRVSLTIDNCYNKVDIVKTFANSWCHMAGILGKIDSHTATITNCVNYGDVDGSIGGDWQSGNNMYGGFVGSASNALVLTNCYNMGDIKGHANSRGGGFVGCATIAMTVTNCKSSGIVSSTRANHTGYLFGAVTVAGSTLTNNVAYTKNYAVDSVVTAVVGSDAANATGTVNATDELTVPTASIFEDFLVATTYGATLGAVESYADISSYRGQTKTAPTKAGFVFAGWYTDEACTTPIPQSVSNGAAYAKFVDADVLSVKYQITAGTTAQSESTALRLLTSVESLDIMNVGFKITFASSTVDKLEKNVFKSIAGGTVTYGANAFSGASEYFATYTMTDIPAAVFGSAFTVVPVWTTLDGTVISGASCEIVISENF